MLHSVWISVPMLLKTSLTNVSRSLISRTVSILCSNSLLLRLATDDFFLDRLWTIWLLFFSFDCFLSVGMALGDMYDSDNLALDLDLDRFFWLLSLSLSCLGSSRVSLLLVLSFFYFSLIGCKDYSSSLSYLAGSNFCRLFR